MIQVFSQSGINERFHNVGSMIDYFHYTLAGRMYGPKLVQQSRLGRTVEVLSALVSVNSNFAPYRPGMSRKLGLVELMQVLSGYFDERHLLKVAPNLLYRYGIAHAYGIKIAHQLPGVIEQLKTYGRLGTRRAMLHIGKAEDGFETEKPCMNNVQFLVRDGSLYTSVHARSWDISSGLPYDIFVMNGLAQIVGHLIGVYPSTTTFFAGSLHLYNNVWEEQIDKMGITYAGHIEPKWNTFLTSFPFYTWEEVREWAIDQLQMDNLDDIGKGYFAFTKMR